MGFFDTFFGEDPSVTTRSRLLPQQSRALNVLGPELRQGLKTGEREAPQLSELELTSLGGLEEFARSLMGPREGGPSPVAGQAQESLLDLLTAQPTDIEELFKTGVEDPLLRTFEERTLPGIRQQFAGNQAFFGGERIGAEERGREDLTRVLAEARANAVLGEVGATRQAKLQALGLAPDIGIQPARETGADIGNLISLLGAGGVPRQQRAGELDERSRRVNQLLQLLGVQTTDTVVDPGTEGIIGDVAKIAAAFAPTPA